MAGDIIIKDRITSQDFRNLDAVGVVAKVLLDLTHAKSQKPIHLDIQLDFSQIDADKLKLRLSELKQKYTSTYGKLRFGEFEKLKGSLKKISATYEAAAFGGERRGRGKERARVAESPRRCKAGDPGQAYDRGKINVVRVVVSPLRRRNESPSKPVKKVRDSTLHGQSVGTGSRVFFGNRIVVVYG
jgi:hypothetical protein